MRSGIFDHVERFSGHAPGKVEGFFRWNAQWIFSPVNASRAAAADGTAGFFYRSATLAEIPEKTRRRQTGMLECRLHMEFSPDALCRAERLDWPYRGPIN
jgi:hypothetical protein